MFDNRDFTVCENCGGNCYLGNKYCEYCANELWEFECQINSDILAENKLLEKALELACELIKNISIVAKFYGGEEPKGKVKDVDYFKTEAKEKMKSE